MCYSWVVPEVFVLKLRDVVGVSGEDEGYGAVVDAGDLHVCGELAVLGVYGFCFELFAEILV